MNFFAKSLVCLVLATASSTLVKADSIPYAHPGTIAPQVTTYASSNVISVYYHGSTAAYSDSIQVYDVQTGYNSGNILNNKSSNPGDMVTVGTQPGQINIGDQLVFYINSPDGLFASIASYSADTVNHAYITNYSGGYAGIPAGLFVGMEDLPNGHSDFNYNDETVVFTGVSAPSLAATPEPGSLALLGTGTLSLLGLARRRFLAA